jgi:hypothetical protein
MRHQRIVASLGTVILLLSTALAQTGNSQPVADSKSTPAASVNERTTPPDPCASPTAANGKTFCEVAQRPQGPPFPPRMGRPRGGSYGYSRYPGYPSPWTGEGHPGHALIGVLIGGALGATLGTNTHPNHEIGPNVVGGIFLGGLGAVIGGVIGNSIGGSHFHRYRRQSWPDEDEMGSRSKAPEAQQIASVKQAPTQQSGKEASPSAQSPATP